MEYRFSVTPRLLAVGACASVALLVLLFALGYEVGQRMAGDDTQVAPAATRAGMTPASATPAGKPVAPAATAAATPPATAATNAAASSAPQAPAQKEWR
jgi:hypothetical protein